MKRPLITFNDETSATAAADALTAENLLVEVKSASDKTKTLFTVEVDEPDQKRALEILDAGKHADGAIHCPGCDAVTVEFPARPRASALINAATVVVDAIVPPKVHEFYCQTCTKHWQ